MARPASNSEPAKPYDTGSHDDDVYKNREEGTFGERGKGGKSVEGPGMWHIRHEQWRHSVFVLVVFGVSPFVLYV